MGLNYKSFPLFIYFVVKKAHHKSKKKMDDELLKCPICFEIAIDPRFFPLCGHTFCLSCILKNMRISKTCMVCRKECTIRDPYDLPSNFVLKNLIEVKYPEKNMMLEIEKLEEIILTSKNLKKLDDYIIALNVSKLHIPKAEIIQLVQLNYHVNEPLIENEFLLTCFRNMKRFFMTRAVNIPGLHQYFVTFIEFACMVIPNCKCILDTVWFDFIRDSILYQAVDRGQVNLIEVCLQCLILFREQYELLSKEQLEHYLKYHFRILNALNHIFNCEVWSTSKLLRKSIFKFINEDFLVKNELFGGNMFNWVLFPEQTRITRTASVFLFVTYYCLYTIKVFGNEHYEDVMQILTTLEYPLIEPPSSLIIQLKTKLDYCDNLYLVKQMILNGDFKDCQTYIADIITEMIYKERYEEELDDFVRENDFEITHKIFTYVIDPNINVQNWIYIMLRLLFDNEKIYSTLWLYLKEKQDFTYLEKFINKKKSDSSISYCICCYHLVTILNRFDLGESIIDCVFEITKEECVILTDARLILKSKFSQYYSNKILDFICNEIKNNWDNFTLTEIFVYHEGCKKVKMEHADLLSVLETLTKCLLQQTELLLTMVSYYLDLYGTTKELQRLVNKMILQEEDIDISEEIYQLRLFEKFYSKEHETELDETLRNVIVRVNKLVDRYDTLPENRIIGSFIIDIVSKNLVSFKKEQIPLYIIQFILTHPYCLDENILENITMILKCMCIDWFGCACTFPDELIKSVKIVFDLIVKRTVNHKIFQNMLTIINVFIDDHSSWFEKGIEDFVLKNQEHIQSFNPDYLASICSLISKYRKSFNEQQIIEFLQPLIQKSIYGRVQLCLLEFIEEFNIPINDLSQCFKLNIKNFTKDDLMKSNRILMKLKIENQREILYEFAKVIENKPEDFASTIRNLLKFPPVQNHPYDTKIIQKCFKFLDRKRLDFKFKHVIFEFLCLKQTEMHDLNKFVESLLENYHYEKFGSIIQTKEIKLKKQSYVSLVEIIKNHVKLENTNTVQGCLHLIEILTSSEFGAKILFPLLYKDLYKVTEKPKLKQFTSNILRIIGNILKYNFNIEELLFCKTTKLLLLESNETQLVHPKLKEIRSILLNNHGENKT